MSEPPPLKANFPPVRACIFDVDGLLINSEDIYTDIYNTILRSYNRPDLPWSIKAKQQSRGREVQQPIAPTHPFPIHTAPALTAASHKGTLQLLSWANLPLTPAAWTAKVTAHHALFKTCTPLPGIPTLLSTLSSHTAPPMHLSLASSATSKTFALKTSHLPQITAAFPPSCRVFGDDEAMSEGRRKPMPDVYLLALERVNAGVGVGERRVEVGECLVFEDSVAGVMGGRGAGMRVCWVPHVGLRGVWRGREEEVLGARGGEEVGEGGEKEGEEGEEEGEEGRRNDRSDGWAEMLMSLEDFDYEHYGIQLKHS